jgi:hypothetical protein
MSITTTYDCTATTYDARAFRAMAPAPRPVIGRSSARALPVGSHFAPGDLFDVTDLGTSTKVSDPPRGVPR